jgi:recombination associated protein RdgC
MWFKQIQYFHLKQKMAYEPETLSEALQNLAFEPCLPGLPLGMGFTSPVDEIDAPIVHAANGYMMVCLQVEEKILPATVVRQALQDRIKVIAHTQDRKVPYKEKQALQADIIATFLPRAFTRMKRLYAYVDTKRQCVILNVAHPKEVGYFLNSWKKVLPDYLLISPELKDLSYELTQWLQLHTYPQAFSIEKACMLQDDQQQGRTIRCQQQNLSVDAIQSLITDGCQVKQLALCWQDRVQFKLTSEGVLRGLDFQDKLQAAAEFGDAETAQQQFDTDFVIMTETIAQLMDDLLAAISSNQKQEKTVRQAEAIA